MKIMSVVMALLLACSVLTLSSCSADDSQGGANGGVTKLSFSEANSVENMEKLDGEKVSIIGYMSTLSPINGQFMYLMNMPYQSCPFCVPNTTQLSNTLAVYAKNGKKFEFTDLLIRVEGVLEFGDYTDEYGYDYSFRIKDAEYTKVDSSELGEKVMLWQQLAASGVVADVYTMYDYLHFTCSWGTYTYSFGEGSDYIYPTDLEYFLFGEGTQYNYGYVDGYFDSLVYRIEEVDKEAFSGLVQNIRDAEALATEALAALAAGEYEMVSEYSGSFGDGRPQYILTNYAEFNTRMNEIFSFFSSWLAEWEL